VLSRNWLTVAEVVQLLSKDEQTVRRWARLRLHALGMVKDWFVGLTITQQNRVLETLESANDGDDTRATADRLEAQATI